MREDWRCFVDLIKSFILEQPPIVCKDINWGNIIQLGEIHSVTGIVGYMIKQLPLHVKPKQEIADRFSNETLNTIRISVQRVYALERLIEKFDKNKIQYVLFKGCIIRDYYPVRELRTFGDIDILIREDDRDRLGKLMIEMGYLEKLGEPNVRCYSRGLEFYEIHTQLLIHDLANEVDYAEYLNDKVWGNLIEIEGTSGYKMNPEFHFIYLLIHLAKHIYDNGAGIRMYADIALYIRNGPELDWAHIKTELISLKLWKFASSVFDICGRWFSIEIPIEYEKMEDCVFETACEYVLSAGTFGYYKRNLAIGRLRKEYEKGRLINRVKFKSIIRFFFPSYNSLKHYMRFLEGKPWLLPIGWIIRYYEGIFKRRKKALSIMKGIFKEEEIIYKHYRLFKQLGLYTDD